jgi:hypothetical protein
MPNLLQAEDVGCGSQACLIWLSKFQRLLANINALGQTGQLLSRDRAAKNGRESTCVSGFQIPKDEDSCLELDMMFIYMKFLVRFFPEILIPWDVVLTAYPDSHLGDTRHYQMRCCEPLCHSMKWDNFQVIFS